MWLLGLICFLAGASHAAEVCFAELGCFSDLPPWGGTAQRPASILPWDPKKIGTRFLLFTQKNRYYQEIKMDQNIQASNYNGKRSTRFVIPGFLIKDDEDWPQEMCKVMVKSQNVNCVAVEWKNGVKTRYAQAANNVRVVAAEVASMITFLMGSYQQQADKFHIIGHSIGAHVAGDAGSRVRGLARITGLDPAEPYFQDTSPTVCLDAGDATFVDVIHTDGLPFNSNLGLGMSQPVGHLDFYPNGGELMPGCSANKGHPTDLDAIWEGTKKFDACNHIRAYQYYSESIAKPQGFLGFPCSDKDSFAAGLCLTCENGQCPLMGQSADKFTLTDSISKTNYFLNTGSSEPFGRYSYWVTITLDGPSWNNRGYIFLAFVGSKGSSKEHQFFKGTLSRGETYKGVIDAELDVGDVKEVTFRWNNNAINPLKPKYGASRVELQRGKDNNIVVFCGIQKVVENAVQSVLPCQA